jgi:acyl carrier protein
MDNQQIFEKISSIVKSINPDATITETSELIGESILDSLEFMNYITKIEEEYSLSISDAEISTLQLGIINNMINYLSTKIN